MGYTIATRGVLTLAFVSLNANEAENRLPCSASLICCLPSTPTRESSITKNRIEHERRQQRQNTKPNDASERGDVQHPKQNYLYKDRSGNIEPRIPYPCFCRVKRPHCSDEGVKRGQGHH